MNPDDISPWFNCRSVSEWREGRSIPGEAARAVGIAMSSKGLSFSDALWYCIQQEIVIPVDASSAIADVAGLHRLIDETGWPTSTGTAPIPTANARGAGAASATGAPKQAISPGQVMEPSASKAPATRSVQSDGTQPAARQESSMSFAVRHSRGDALGWLPVYGSREEADAFVAHVRRINPEAELSIEEVDEPPTHFINEQTLMRPIDSPEAPWEVVGVRERPGDGSPSGYSIALLNELLATCERGELAFIEGSPVSPNQEFQPIGFITVVAPEHTTVWNVSIVLDSSIDAARFVVDMDERMMTAPGMFPDPKPGYVMWEGEPGDATIALVWRDPDTYGIESDTVEGFAGRLPSVGEGRTSSDDLVDLAHLILRKVLGYVDLIETGQ